MKGKMMKKFAYLFILLFVAVITVNCGGGGSDPSAPAVKDYVYATDQTIVPAFEKGVDYTIDNWTSGAVHDEAFADVTYDPCIQIDNTASTWGGDGAIAFTGFTAGFASSYTTLHLKATADTAQHLKLKFPGATGAQEEVVYSGTAVSIGATDWVEFTIPLSNHGDLSTVTEFAFISTGNFYLTDIYFGDAATPAIIAGDDDGDSLVVIGKVSEYVEVDLDYGTDYAIGGNGISDWGTGGGISDPMDAEYGWVYVPDPGTMGHLIGTVYGVPSGNWWGRDAGAIAFSFFNAGFASPYTTMNFKFNAAGLYDSVNVKFPGATTEELTYDLATYGTAIGVGDWYEVLIPMAGHGDVSTSTEFAILRDGVTTFMVTDIYFD